MKKVLIAVAVVVVVLVLAVVGLVAFGISQIDTLVKMGIERGGTHATGVNTQVDTVDVSLRRGTFDMQGFQLDNPPGFDTPHFLALSDTAVQLNADATDRRTVTLSNLTLTGIDVYLDKGRDPSNYNTILENLRRFESGEEAPPPEDDAMRVVIETLVIENVDVHLANMPGVGVVAGDIAVNVPRIELRNVGADEPMTFGEVIGLVVKTVLAASVEAGGGIIPGDVLGELAGGLGSLESLSEMGVEAVGEIGERINEQLGAATERAREAVDEARRAGEDIRNQAEDAADRVRGIFKGDEEEP